MINLKYWSDINIFLVNVDQTSLVTFTRKWLANLWQYLPSVLLNKSVMYHIECDIEKGVQSFKEDVPVRHHELQRISPSNCITHRRHLAILCYSVKQGELVAYIKFKLN